MNEDVALNETVLRARTVGRALPPVVLVGAGRGGTTLLYKLLALHRDVGFLSNYQHRFPSRLELAWLHRWVRDRHGVKLRTWFKPDGGAYFPTKRERLHAAVPTPFECEALYAHCGIPLHPEPNRPPDDDACAKLYRAFEAVRRGSGAPVLITKRTANNRRIAWLERALPGVRYIHLVRDGRAVARSLLQVNWWNDHTLFWAGQTPVQMVAAGYSDLELAARNWVEELTQIRAGLVGVQPSRVLTLHYEDLLRLPDESLGRAMEFIGVPVASDAGFTAAIASLGLRPSTAAWDRDLSEQQVEQVLAIQSTELGRCGYIDSGQRDTAVCSR